MGLVTVITIQLTEEVQHRQPQAQERLHFFVQRVPSLD